MDDQDIFFASAIIRSPTDSVAESNRDTSVDSERYLAQYVRSLAELVRPSVRASVRTLASVDKRSDGRRKGI